MNGPNSQGPKRRRGPRRGPPREKRKTPEQIALETWEPKTKIGKQVLAGDLTSLDAIKKLGRPIREPEIVDTLVQDLEEQVIAIGKAGRPFKMAQRMTDSGRRNRYQVLVAVGNRAGYVGLGQGKAKEFGPARRKALKEAKLNMFKVPIGCGSWECACGGKHTVPYISEGSSGSVNVKLIPAPKGIGLASSATAKVVLGLSGLKDVWSKSRGHTKSRTNLAWATFEALRNLDNVKGAK